MAQEDVHKIDSILQLVGPKGRFTVLQLFLLWLGVVPAAIQLLSNVYIGFPVPHRCHKPNNETEKAYLQQFDDVSNASVTYGQCDIQIVSNGHTFHTDTCIFGMTYDLPKETSFVSEFDLVCESTNLGRLTQTLVIAGQGCGAFSGSLLADRIGRRFVILGTNLGLLATGIAIAYAPSSLALSIFKFIVGFFQNAQLAVNCTLTIELFSINDRRIGAAMHALFWAFGVVMLDVIALPMKGYSWRTLQLVLSLTSLGVVVMWWFLKESLRWLMVNGKVKESITLVRYMAHMNKKNPDEVLKNIDLQSSVKMINEEKIEEESRNVTQVPTENKLSFLDLLRVPRLLVNSLVMWLAWFTTATSYFAIHMTATRLAGDKYLNHFLISLMEVPSFFFLYFGMNRYGRKGVSAGVFAMVGIGLVASGILRSMEQTPVISVCSVLSYMISMAGASGCFSIVFSYTPELYPTNIRNQALGMASMMARIGGMLAPFTAVLSEKAIWAPGVLIGGLATLVILLLRFLPETSGRELPQTLEELLLWSKDNKECNNDKMENMTTEKN